MISDTIPHRVIDLRAWRLRAGYKKMSEVARLIGYAEASALGRMERGKRPIPEDRLVLLEELFGPDPPMMDKPESQPILQSEFWTFWWEYTVELFCPHCGRTAEWPVKSDERVKITYVPRLRCGECHAHVIVANITEERKREPKPSMYMIPDDEKPKRGRPPNNRRAYG